MTEHDHDPEVWTGTANVRSRDADGIWRTRTTNIHGARCSCGWQGPTRTHQHEAEDDRTDHWLHGKDQQ